MAAAASSAQAAQDGLVTAMGYDIERAFNLLDISSLRDSLPKFTAAIAVIVRRYGLASATLAARYYQAERKAQGVTTAFTPRPAEPPPLDQIAKTVDWATSPLWSSDPDLTATQKRLTGSLDTLVLDVGRETVTDNVQRDRKAIAWARIPEQGACYFCALLATRGAVYKQDTADFKSHDHCRCHAEPVFTAYEPSAQVREWQALYRDQVKGGQDLLKTWRGVFEQRNSPSGTATPTPQEG